MSKEGKKRTGNDKKKYAKGKEFFVVYVLRDGSGFFGGEPLCLGKDAEENVGSGTANMLLPLECASVLLSTSFAS